MSFSLLGIGSPLVDYSLELSEALLAELVPGGKGCTRNISQAQKKDILQYSGDNVFRTPGGSAANTVRIFAALGGKSSLFGKTGIDEDADFFRDELLKTGADDSLLLQDKEYPTGFCLSLITPDAERTMLSDLAASQLLKVEETAKIDFSQFQYLLMEGYLSKGEWVMPMFAQAGNAGCKIALDLNNFELVSRERKRFMQIINSGIDLIFGNEEEFSALFPGTALESLPALLRQCVPLAVIKRGAKGALIVTEKELIPVDAITDDKIKDTTGAGDFFAAGFLFGISKNCSLPICGKLGTLCAAAIIRETGTILPATKMEILKQNIYKEVRE